MTAPVAAPPTAPEAAPSPVAVDQAAAPPQAIDINGKQVEKTTIYPLACTPDDARELAKFLAIHDHQAAADQISAQLGDGEVEVSWTDAHPVATGAILGAVATLAIGTGVYYGRQWYKDRKFATNLPEGKVVKMAGR